MMKIFISYFQNLAEFVSRHEDKFDDDSTQKEWSCERADTTIASGGPKGC